MIVVNVSCIFDEGERKFLLDPHLFDHDPSEEMLKFSRFIRSLYDFEQKNVEFRLHFDKNFEDIDDILQPQKVEIFKDSRKYEIEFQNDTELISDLTAKFHSLYPEKNFLFFRQGRDFVIYDYEKEKEFLRSRYVEDLDAYSRLIFSYGIGSENELKFEIIDLLSEKILISQRKKIEPSQFEMIKNATTLESLEIFSGLSINAFSSLGLFDLNFDHETYVVFSFHDRKLFVLVEKFRSDVDIFEFSKVKNFTMDQELHSIKCFRYFLIENDPQVQQDELKKKKIITFIEDEKVLKVNDCVYHLRPLTKNDLFSYSAKALDRRSKSKKPSKLL